MQLLKISFGLEIPVFLVRVGHQVKAREKTYSSSENNSSSALFVTYLLLKQQQQQQFI